MHQLDLLDHLPRRPYCAEAKDAPRRIRPAAQAIRQPYVQPNHPGLLLNLVFDLDDTPQAGVRWQDVVLPPPAWIVLRRDSDASAHYWYPLAIPVPLGDAGNPKAMRLAAAVELGMRRKLGADPAFHASMAKTPGHEVWRTLDAPATYELDELAGWIDLPRLPTEREALQTGLGRNCCLFDTTRHWAYPHVREFAHTARIEDWRRAVYERAMILNADLFRDPLHEPEVRHTAKSIADWTWRQERARTARWKARQAARSKIAAAGRAARANELNTAILEAIA